MQEGGEDAASYSMGKNYRNSARMDGDGRDKVASYSFPAMPPVGDSGVTGASIVYSTVQYYLSEIHVPSSRQKRYILPSLGSPIFTPLAPFLPSYLRLYYMLLVFC